MKDSYKVILGVCSAYVFVRQGLMSIQQARWAPTNELLYFAQFWAFMFFGFAIGSALASAYFAIRRLRRKV